MSISGDSSTEVQEQEQTNPVIVQSESGQTDGNKESDIVQPIKVGKNRHQASLDHLVKSFVMLGICLLILCVLQSYFRSFTFVLASAGIIFCSILGVMYIISTKLYRYRGGSHTHHL